MMDTKQLCVYLNVSKRTVVYLVSKGMPHFQYKKLGKLYFKKEDVDKWLKQYKKGE